MARSGSHVNLSISMLMVAQDDDGDGANDDVGGVDVKRQSFTRRRVAHVL